MVLLETDLGGGTVPNGGKVRDVYDLGETLLLVADGSDQRIRLGSTQRAFRIKDES